jgi:hypothetical protein
VDGAQVVRRIEANEEPRFVKQTMHQPAAHRLQVKGTAKRPATCDTPDAASVVLFDGTFASARAGIADKSPGASGRVL